MKVTLLVPTINEEIGMRAIMPRVRREWVDQILVVDGGSTDDTVAYARQCGYDVFQQTRPGLRHAYADALPHVRGDVIVTFSPDGNSIPELIPALIAKMAEGYDMAIASRYKDGARSQDDTWATGWGNWFFTKSINVMHGGHYTDALVIFRAYRKQMVRELRLDEDASYERLESFFRTRVSWEPLLSVRAARRKLRIAEIAADEPPRIGGVAKPQLFRCGAIFYLQFLRELFA